MHYGMCGSALRDHTQINLPHDSLPSYLSLALWQIANNIDSLPKSVHL